MFQIIRKFEESTDENYWKNYTKLINSCNINTISFLHCTDTSGKNNVIFLREKHQNLQEEYEKQFKETSKVVSLTNFRIISSSHQW